MNTRAGLLALSAVAVASLFPTTAEASSSRQSRSAETRSAASPRSTPPDQTLAIGGSAGSDIPPDWSTPESPEAYAHARLRGRVSTTPNDLPTTSSSLLDDLQLPEGLNGDGLDLPGGFAPLNFNETDSETPALQTVPEPGALVLLGVGLLAVARRMKSRRAKAGAQVS